MSELIVLVCGVVIGVVCMAVGYFIGTRGVGKYRHEMQSKFEHLEAIVQMCRQTANTALQDVAGVLNQIQMMDAYNQQMDREKMAKLEKDMRDAILGGNIPQAVNPFHPKVDRSSKA